MDPVIPVWANWNMGGTWLSTNIWEYYIFTKDNDFFKKGYPLLKGAVQFCLDWLVVDHAGKLITLAFYFAIENKIFQIRDTMAQHYTVVLADLAMIEQKFWTRQLKDPRRI